MPKMVFIEKDGNRKEVDAPVGLSVMEIAHKHGVDIEGACEGSLACSTCHVIVDNGWFGKLEEPSEEIESTERGLAFHRALARLHTRLRAAGIHHPEESVDDHICARLAEAVEECAVRASPAGEALWASGTAR